MNWVSFWLLLGCVALSFTPRLADRDTVDVDLDEAPFDAARHQKGHAEFGGDDILDQDAPKFTVTYSSHRHVLHPDAAGRRAPRLVVSFSVASAIERLKLVLPPDYVLVKSGKHSVAGNNTEAFTGPPCEYLFQEDHAEDVQQLLPLITKCEVSETRKLHAFDGDSEEKADRESTPVTRAELTLDVDASRTEPLTWWSFEVAAWLPAETPPAAQNIFELVWLPPQATEWVGASTFEADPVLGDWDCIYSDWTGWGSCSARCGQGIMQVRRHILLEPPPGGSGKQCEPDTLTRPEPCNQHPCEFPCHWEGPLATQERPAQCSAACGGGVMAHRQLWTGDSCPSMMDYGTVRLSPCNIEECAVPCLYEDGWEVATECSATCGRGTYWVLKRLKTKGIKDQVCQERWMELPCVRQSCTNFMVTGADRNMLPYANADFRISVLFQPPRGESIRKIQVKAPLGYSFGIAGAPCKIYDHNLMPFYTEDCLVGKEPNVFDLHFSDHLPAGVKKEVDPNFWNGYGFQVDVSTPQCKKEAWRIDPMMTSVTCSAADDEDNQWEMHISSAEVSGKAIFAADGFALYATELIDVDNLVLHDERSCIGQLNFNSQQQLCAAVSQSPSADATVLLKDCRAEGSKQNSYWSLPPSGEGLIQLSTLNLCLAFSQVEASAKGLPLQLAPCRRDAPEQKWIATDAGLIKSVPNPTLCMSASAGTPEAQVVLGECSETPAWSAPCLGGSSRHKSSKPVLERKRRPSFCSNRFQCPHGSRCSRMGVCEDHCEEQHQD